MTTYQFLEEFINLSPASMSRIEAYGADVFETWQQEVDAQVIMSDSEEGTAPLQPDWYVTRLLKLAAEERDEEKEFSWDDWQSEESAPEASDPFHGVEPVEDLPAVLAWLCKVGARSAINDSREAEQYTGPSTQANGECEDSLWLPEWIRRRLEKRPGRDAKQACIRQQSG